MEADLSFVSADGVERREPLDAVADVLYEEAQPFRSFPSFKGQWISSCLRSTTASAPATSITPVPTARFSPGSEPSTATADGR